MARYYAIYVARSDGKLETIQKHNKAEKNEPTPEQLDSTPNVNGVRDYYREIPAHEPKHLDWRRKLGGMMLREVGEPENQHKGCILAALPENYRLYEHIKQLKDGDKKASKNHAGGGHDRQDAYLYGHPLGRKKRFRSPADFFPHLLWLMTDKAGDPDNCSCKLCCPEELQGEAKPAPVKGLKESVSAPASPKSRDPIVAIPRRSSANQTPNQPSPARQLSEPAPRPTSAGPQATQAQVQAQSQPQSQSQVPSHLRLPDWNFDCQYDTLLFRPGEIVWYNRGGGAWGLGVITRRWLGRPDPSSQQMSKNYIVQPLSHPLQHPQPVLLTQQTWLRPWLAWSPPACTISQLKHADLTYERVDWTQLVQTLLNGGLDGNPVVDASILAAKSIDGTFTLRHLINNTPLGPAGTERRWGALFLGAEKIWVGEPVRLRQTSNDRENVLVVSAISERIQPPSSYAPGSTGSQYAVALMGDLWTFSRMPWKAGWVPPANARKVPARMQEDATARARISIPVRREVGAWQLVKPNASAMLASVKGRWYESSLLLPILKDGEEPGRRWEDTIKHGWVDDAGGYMNGRGDSLAGRNGHGFSQGIGNGVRQPERRDALGRSVPQGMQLFDELTEPSAVELHGVEIMHPDQQQDQHMQDQHQDHQSVEPFDPSAPGLDEFMNLDNMEGDSTMLDESGFGGQTGPAFF